MRRHAEGSPRAAYPAGRFVPTESSALADEPCARHGGATICLEDLQFVPASCDDDTSPSPPTHLGGGRGGNRGPRCAGRRTLCPPLPPAGETWGEATDARRAATHGAAALTAASASRATSSPAAAAH